MKNRLGVPSEKDWCLLWHPDPKRKNIPQYWNRTEMSRFELNLLVPPFRIGEVLMVMVTAKDMILVLILMELDSPCQTFLLDYETIQSPLRLISTEKPNAAMQEIHKDDLKTPYLRKNNRNIDFDSIIVKIQGVRKIVYLPRYSTKLNNFSTVWSRDMSSFVDEKKCSQILFERVIVHIIKTFHILKMLSKKETLTILSRTFLRLHLFFNSFFEFSVF